MLLVAVVSSAQGGRGLLLILPLRERAGPERRSPSRASRRTAGPGTTGAGRGDVRSATQWPRSRLVRPGGRKPFRNPGPRLAEGRPGPPGAVRGLASGRRGLRRAPDRRHRDNERGGRRRRGGDAP